MLNVVDFGCSDRYEFDYNSEIHFLQQMLVPYHALGEAGRLFRAGWNFGETQHDTVAGPINKDQAG
jgi:hypothetical protein